MRVSRGNLYSLNIDRQATTSEVEHAMTSIKIGVVGYSAQKFDEGAARTALNNLFDAASSGRHDVTVVSGLTDLGIPAVAYRIAQERGWQTAGVACAKAQDYECFPVDEQTIVGDNWGDESETFLATCDVLIRIGGGKQSLAEVAQFKETGRPVYEFDLASLPG